MLQKKIYLLQHLPLQIYGAYSNTYIDTLEMIFMLEFIVIQGEWILRRHNQALTFMHTIRVKF